MDSKIKKNITNQNNYICKFGPLRNMTKYNCCKNTYNENYNLGDSELYENFGDVFVLKVNTVDIARELINYNLKPVIVNVVNENFTGGNIDNLEGVYDEDLNLRTNFSIIAKVNNNYPPKKTEVIYTEEVIVLRDDKINPLPLNNCYKVSIITCSTYKKYNFEKTDESRLAIDEYIYLKQKIETIMQTAHLGNNNAIIFRDFGCLEDGLPINDLVEIYNSAILKYGQFFKNIIFCIPIKTSKDIPIFNYFLKEIIKPQELINENDLGEDFEEKQNEILTRIIASSIT